MVSMSDVAVSLKSCLVFHARDWAADKRDAWLWGIVCGWDEAAMTEVAAKFGWPTTEVQRLNELHAAFMAHPTQDAT